MTEELMKLKAEAYDLISVMEQARLRLNEINQKILALSQEEKS